MAAWLNPLSWPIEPAVLLGVEVVAILYWRGGARRVHARRDGWNAERWRAVAFWLSLVAILVALDSPIETYARSLFWMHMVQHLLLITVAAPLLVLSASGLQIWRGLPLSIRRTLARFFVKHARTSAVRGVFRFITTPVPAFVIAAAGLWIWHYPPLYDLTLRNHLVHHLEHAIFLGIGILFYAQVIDQPPFHARLSSLGRTVFAFAGLLPSWLLAGVLAFASSPFYAYAHLASRPGGISALTDQQIAAGFMWVPGSITTSLVFIVCLFRWLDEEDRRAATPERVIEVAAR